MPGAPAAAPRRRQATSLERAAMVPPTIGHTVGLTARIARVWEVGERPVSGTKVNYVRHVIKGPF